MPRPYQAVIFDMDGLLLDSERPIKKAWIEVSQAHGFSVSDEIFLQVVGRTSPDGRAHFIQTLGEHYPYESVRATVHQQLAAAHAQTGYDVKPGAVDLLKRLQAQGIPCAVASSTQRDEVESRLRLAGLWPYFASVIGGNEVTRGKPNPDIYLLAAQRISTDPARCLAFEDSDHGAHAALAAGMDVVVVPDLKHPGDALRACCTAVLSSLNDATVHHARWFHQALLG